MSKLACSIGFIFVIFFEVFANANNNSSSYSENTCINEANEENLALKRSFTQCWDPLGMDYLAYSSAVRQTTNLPKAVETSLCSIDNLAGQRIDLYQVSEALNEEDIERVHKQKKPDGETLGFLPSGSATVENKADMIKKECIIASMKRNPGNKGYVCEYPGDKNPKGINPTKQTISKYYGLASGSTAQCADNQMSDYVHFAVNSAIQCLSGLGKVDSKTIFRKINNESAFNVSVSSNDGVGIAQLTPIAVKEMIDPKVGRGRYVLQHVAQSSDLSCNGFKGIANQDLSNAPSTAGSNRCAWISPGDGLARNLIYSIGYYMTMRDQYIVPALLKRAPSLSKNQELLNDLVSIAYGAEGIKHAKELLSRFRVNDKTDLVELQKKIRKNSRYLSNIKLKMKELICIKNGWHDKSKECQRHEMTREELEGETCVAPI